MQVSACADILTPDPSDKCANGPDCFGNCQEAFLCRYFGIIVDSILNI